MGRPSSLSHTIRRKPVTPRYAHPVAHSPTVEEADYHPIANSRAAAFQNPSVPNAGETQRQAGQRSPIITTQLGPTASPSTFCADNWLTLRDHCQIPVDEFYLPTRPQMPVNSGDFTCDCSDDGFGTAAGLLALYPRFAARAWGIEEAHAEMMAGWRRRSWDQDFRCKVLDRQNDMSEIFLAKLQEALRDKAKEISGADGLQAQLWRAEDEKDLCLRKVERNEKKEKKKERGCSDILGVFRKIGKLRCVYSRD
ncbi:hypothetical protein TruAng_003811 [Truncatella angustata]|nr:hypothetical protein TruAng_003811 [Truncatella angustata]